MLKKFFFITVLVNGVGRFVKTVRNATIKTTVKNYRITAYYGTEFGTLFCLLLYVCLHS